MTWDFHYSDSCTCTKCTDSQGLLTKTSCERCPAGDPNCVHIGSVIAETNQTYTVVVSDQDDFDAVLPARTVKYITVSCLPCSVFSVAAMMSFSKVSSTQAWLAFIMRLSFAGHPSQHHLIEAFCRLALCAGDVVLQSHRL